ncbi:MAG TPA: DUF1080 domain-containing protein [Gammaproteobacteria bacterium]|nr:DUF1080 domain-containing protein [Gammaproteobacteria bacterium]
MRSLHCRGGAARLALFAAFAVATAGAQPAPVFSPLFDGALGEATIENGGAFTIEGGVLRAEGPQGWLRFAPLLRDFRLRVELRFLTDNADSGVFFRAVPDGSFARGWPNRSYQVQTLNPLAGGPLPPVGGLFRHGMPPGETTLDREAVRAAFTGTSEWQLLEIEVVGTELAVQLNGVVVTKASGIADVAGYVGIQSETGVVEFRRIDVEELERR